MILVCYLYYCILHRNTEASSYWDYLYLHAGIQLAIYQNINHYQPYILPILLQSNPIQR
nr:MAG TPA: hypothetical protein [Bacteriophage sp.]DAR42009.1 MAG TPA: hypothetical protein [Bacteriophage sp.]